LKWGILLISQIDPELVYETFKAASVGRNFSVYKKDEIPEEWHFGNSRRVGPIVLITDVGYVFDDFYGAIESYNEEFNLTGNCNYLFIYFRPLSLDFWVFK